MVKHGTVSKYYEIYCSFSQLFFKSTGVNALTRLIICLKKNQPANHDMLQKELINGSRESVTQNAKLLLRMSILNLREIWSSMALFEFGLGKFDIS